MPSKQEMIEHYQLEGYGMETAGKLAGSTSGANFDMKKMLGSTSTEPNLAELSGLGVSGLTKIIKKDRKEKRDRKEKKSKRDRSDRKSKKEKKSKRSRAD